ASSEPLTSPTGADTTDRQFASSSVTAFETKDSTGPVQSRAPGNAIDQTHNPGAGASATDPSQGLLIHFADLGARLDGASARSTNLAVSMPAIDEFFERLDQSAIDAIKCALVQHRHVRTHLAVDLSEASPLDLTNLTV